MSLPQERKLCAFPTIEICSSDIINYMVPLSRQTDFFVPEMKEEVKTDVKEEDSDEDRGTDITGNVTLLLLLSLRQEMIDSISQNSSPKQHNIPDVKRNVCLFH